MNKPVITRMADLGRTSAPQGRKGLSGKFVGNFGVKGSGNNSTYYLYELDDTDREFVANVPLKQYQQIFRCDTDRSYVAKEKYLVKIDFTKEMVYFLTEEAMDSGSVDTSNFESRGYKLQYLNILSTAVEERDANWNGKYERCDFDKLREAAADVEAPKRSKYSSRLAARKPVEPVAKEPAPAVDNETDAAVEQLLKDVYGYKFTGNDNYGKPKRNYLAQLVKMSDKELYEECKSKIWLSAYANNNSRSDYHWHCDACYAECGRRNKKDIYNKAYKDNVSEN